MPSVNEKLALAALEIGAIKLQPSDPFTWTSGYRMPIYNDNRLLLSKFENRELVSRGFAEIVETHAIQMALVAGTATAGISPATTLADRLKTRFAYVRQASKEHGTKSRIEGTLNAGEKALLVEDLISTGGSSISAVQALREAGATVEHCLAIFSYGFEKAAAAFAEQKCALHVLLTFSQLLGIAKQNGYISSAEEEMLSSWSEDPFGWGEKHGFAKKEK